MNILALFLRIFLHQIAAVLPYVEEIEKQVGGDQNGIEDVQPDDYIVAVQGDKVTPDAEPVFGAFTVEPVSVTLIVRK